MKVTVEMDVPDAFAADAFANAQADVQAGRLIWPFPIHAAIRAMIEDGLPIRVSVQAVTVCMENGDTQTVRK